MRTSRRSVLAAAGTVLIAGCSGGESSGADGDGNSEEDSGTVEEDQAGGGEESPDGDGEASDGEGTATESQPEPSVTDPSLVLNWRINGLHAPYFAAQAQGFYADEGFDSVDIQGGEGSDFAAQQAALGNTEFAISSSDQVLNVNSGDLSPRSVGVVMQRNPAVIFTARENFGAELTDPGQLEGLTVGSGPGMVRQMTQAYLDAHGIRESVEYVDTGYDTVQQLLTGEVDAAGGVFSDAVDARNQDYQIDTLSIHESIPSYGHLVTVGSDFASENPETVRAFLRATARGAVWATRNPDAAIDALVEARPELEEVRTNQRDKWERMHSSYMRSSAVRENGWGWSIPEPWEQTHETLAEGGFFDAPVEPGDVWTNEYLDTSDPYVGEFAARVTE